MAWSVEFIPDEVDSMTVLIDGAVVLTWESAEGQVTKGVPAPKGNLTSIHIRGEGSPNGRNAHMKVFWDGNEKKEMTFDNGEDHDLEA